MRRRLILMRHAKSSWKSDAVDDHGRPLNKRGRRDSPAVAQALIELGWSPEMVYSSDSQRTRETLELMCEVFQPTPVVEFVPAMYHGGVHEIREAAVGTSADVQTIMALGHNPGWQHAVDWFSGEQQPMSTANAALLQIDGESWREVLHGERTWQLIDVIRPKELKSA